MASQSPTQPNFPPQGYEPAYKYDNQFDQPIPRSYPDPLNAQYAPQPHHQEGQYTPEPQHLDGAAQWSNQPGQVDNGVLPQSDTKARLRKACDSCSVRKVKVSLISSPPAYFARLIALLHSAMKVDRHANLAQLLTFLAPSTALAVDVARLTNMLKLSRDSELAKTEHTQFRAAHLHMMQPIV
jgi:hypothetical protein